MIQTDKDIKFTWLELVSYALVGEGEISAKRAYDLVYKLFPAQCKATHYWRSHVTKALAAMEVTPTPPRTPKSKLLLSKRRWDARKARGLCYSCLQPAVSGTGRCPYHRQKNKERIERFHSKPGRAR